MPEADNDPLKPSPNVKLAWEARDAEKTLCNLSLEHKPLINFFSIFSEDKIVFFGEAGFNDYPNRLNWLHKNYVLFTPGYLYDLFGLEFIFVFRKSPQVIIPQELSEEYINMSNRYCPGLRKVKTYPVYDTKTYKKISYLGELVFSNRYKKLYFKRHK